MNKPNEKYLEHKVEYYKQWLPLFFAVQIGSTAWLVANYDKAATPLIILDTLAVFVFFVILIFINAKIRNYIKRLRD
jgi:hypothetical protein